MSVNQLESMTPGFVAQLKGLLMPQRYNYATTFVDQFSKLSFVFLQKWITSAETVLAKQSFKVLLNSLSSISMNNLTMYRIHPMEVYIFLLMSFTRYIPFPLGIHLLLGQVNPPDLLLGHNLIILGLPSQLEGMMVLYSCLLTSISY